MEASVARQLGVERRNANASAAKQDRDALMRGEHLDTLPDPLHLPPSLEKLSGIAAVHLFLDRSTAAVPSFALTTRNAPVVAEVCHQLEGMKSVSPWRRRQSRAVARRNSGKAS